METEHQKHAMLQQFSALGVNRSTYHAQKLLGTNNITQVCPPKLSMQLEFKALAMY